MHSIIVLVLVSLLYATDCSAGENKKLHSEAKEKQELFLEKNARIVQLWANIKKNRSSIEQDNKGLETCYDTIEKEYGNIEKQCHPWILENALQTFIASSDDSIYSGNVFCDFTDCRMPRIKYHVNSWQDILMMRSTLKQDTIHVVQIIKDGAGRYLADKKNLQKLVELRFQANNGNPYYPLISNSLCRKVRIGYTCQDNRLIQVQFDADFTLEEVTRVKQTMMADAMLSSRVKENLESIKWLYQK